MHFTNERCVISFNGKKIKLQPPEKSEDDIDDCSAEANVKVDTLNCNCGNFACLRQFSYYTKRSR